MPRASEQRPARWSPCSSVASVPIVRTLRQSGQPWRVLSNGHTLALYDRLVTKTERSVLEVAYGKKLNQLVEVAWREEGLEAIADQLGEAYGVNLFIKGNVDVNRTMSLVGEMSLAAIFEHIANTFQVRVINDDGELWFTHDKSKPAPNDLFED